MAGGTHTPHSTLHTPHSTLHSGIIVFAIFFLIIGACSNPFYPTPGGSGGSGTGDSLIVSANLGNLAEVLAVLPAHNTVPYIIKLSVAIPDEWGAVNDKVYAAADKNVILDLSGCNATTISGQVTPSGNDMNIIGDTPNIKGIILPSSLASIGTWAFRDCRSLTSITIPYGVTSIGQFAFSLCYGLPSISIPDSVISILPDAFSDCSGLVNINIPGNVTSIGDSAFQNCRSLTSITIPYGVTIINHATFSGCSGLTSISIPDSVTYIDFNAFYNCSGLTSIDIPDSVTFIGTNAFDGCTDLINVTIPNSVTFIWSAAFDGCTSLTSVTFEPGSAIADVNFGTNVFPGGDALKIKYLVEGAGTYTRSPGGNDWTKVP